MRSLFLLLAALAVTHAQDDASSAASGTSSASAASDSSAAPASADASSSSSSATAADTAGDSVSSGSPNAAGGTPTQSGECTFCTVTPGYTSEQWDAPLNVEDQFSPRWRSAHRKAKNYLANWSLEDKVKLATGTGWMQGRCVGNTADIPERNWTGICLQDSPLGVRFADFVSAFPAGINAATTFDKSLMRQRGKAMGQEFRDKGVNVALGPMTNMVRVPAGGRNWESFGADPYLSGHATFETIKGLQSTGVQASIKHYIANEQERNRTTSSSNLDDRTLREVYAHPFLRAVQADTASVMCSYNLLNGSWASQNSKTLNGILKTDFGFAGYVVSDWDAQHSGVLSANNGLDMSMPGDIGYNGGKTSYWGANLTEAVNNGSVSSARMDDIAQRIMAAWYLLDQENKIPPVNFDTWGPENEHIDVQDGHSKLIRRIDRASVVMLKNEKKTLPLNKPRSMALIGEDMGPARNGPNGFPDRGGIDGTLAMGWGSGTTNFPYLVDPLQALSAQAQKDHTSLSWFLNNWDLEGIANTAKTAEVAVVGINADSGEGYITVDGNEGDRNNLTAWKNGDEVVKTVAANNNNTIVVVHAVSAINMEWANHENITAILWAGIPGQESGNGLTDVMYGKYNPSGRLPYTIAANEDDYPAKIDYVTGNGPAEPNVNYTEGLFIDYRHFQKNGITPLYGFGFGLSYTDFTIDNLNIQPVSDNERRELIGAEGSSNGVATADGNEVDSKKNPGGPATPQANGANPTKMAGEDGETDGAKGGKIKGQGDGKQDVAAVDQNPAEAKPDVAEASNAQNHEDGNGDIGNGDKQGDGKSDGSKTEGGKGGDGGYDHSHDEHHKGDKDHGHGHGHGGGHHGGGNGGDKPKIGRLMTAELHDPRWRVTADVQNTGDVNGCEVPQLYLLFPEGAGEPPRVFRDFARVNLDPGKKETVKFHLSKYDVSIWDVEKQDYVVPQGEFKITVSKNAFDDEGAWGSYTFA